MAELGFRTMDEMIGRADCIDAERAVSHWKARGLDLAPLLHVPSLPASVARRKVREQDHGLDATLDNDLIKAAAPALERRQPVELNAFIRNADRTVGTMLGYHVTRRYGGQGLPDDTIKIAFTGSAGQSFGAFVPRGMTLTLVGDANDGFGKGLSGGRVIVVSPRRRPPSSRRTTSSSATSRSTVRRAAKATCAAWRASASAFATAARRSWSKASGTMPAST